jgi:23S rRNA (adenine(2503)-C(2))-methyltransferase
MHIKSIYKFIHDNNLPPFRAQQIIRAIFQENIASFAEITTLPKDLREKITMEIKILSFRIKKFLPSSDKKSAKALLELEDGLLIETVLLESKKKQWSVCISSQAGCALGCRFCATGALGFKRNLTAEEITDQVLFWKQFIKKFPSQEKWQEKEIIFPLAETTDKYISAKRNFTIVFMGMGEPFANYANVKNAIQSLTDHELFGFGDRHISVSTSGLADGIKKFAKDFPQINLAISLIMPTDAQRTEFMPINKKFNLSDIKRALDYYFHITNRKVFLEYILFRDINDGRKDADNLIGFIRSCSKPELLHINLISYNATTPGLFPATPERTNWFKNYLQKNRISVTVRKSLGDDIHAACGQLSGK